MMNMVANVGGMKSNQKKPSQLPKSKLLHDTSYWVKTLQAHSSVLHPYLLGCI